MNDLVPRNCDKCGKPQNQLELYVVAGKMEYLFFCKECFDPIDATEYYLNIRDGGFIPDIYSEQEFNHHKLDVLPLGFSRGAAIDPKAVLPVDFENRIQQEVMGEFLNKKFLDKFDVQSSKCRLFQKTKYFYEVKCTAICRHKSYKQFLEHELYKQMRKEVNFTIQ